MPIRRRLNVRRKIAYHRQYGSMSNPPLRDGHWPCGSEIIRTNMRKVLLLGYAIRRADFQSGKEYGPTSATVAAALNKALAGKGDSFIDGALAHYRPLDAQHAAWVVTKEVERIHYKLGWGGTRAPGYAPVKRDRMYPLRQWQKDFNPSGDIHYLGEFPSKDAAEEAIIEYYEEKFDTVL